MEYPQYPLRWDDRPPSLADKLAAARGMALAAGGMQTRGGGVPSASSHASAAGHSSAQRERFLLRIRREVIMLGSEQSNALCVAQRYFPHLYAEADSTFDCLAPAASSEVRSSSPTPVAAAAPSTTPGAPVGANTSPSVISACDGPVGAVILPVTPAASHLLSAPTPALSSASAAIVTPPPPFRFRPSPLLQASSWQSHSINYDSLRTQMKKVVYIQAQITAFIAEQERQNALAEASGADSRRKDHGSGEDAAKRTDSATEGDEHADGVSRATVAALRAHPSFQLLRQAHQSFWDMLRTELMRVQDFVAAPDHAARLTALWDECAVEVAQPGEVASNTASPVKREAGAESSSGGAATSNSASTSSTSAPVLSYAQTCPCGCGVLLRDTFRLVVGELSKSGVSHRSSQRVLSDSSTMGGGASAPAAAAATCPQSKELIHKLLSSALHLDQLRRFITVNFVIYQRVIDQFQHYTASALLDKFHRAIWKAEQREAASADAEMKKEGEGATKSEPSSTDAAAIPTSTAAVAAAPAPAAISSSIQQFHLESFLGSDPSWPFRPVDLIAVWTDRCEKILVGSLGKTRGYEHVGSDMSALVASQGDVGCGCCASNPMLAPILLVSCGHQFCLPCLGRQGVFGIACPLTGCGREILSSAEMHSRASMEDVILEEEDRRRRNVASMRAAMRVDVAGVGEQQQQRFVPPDSATSSRALREQTELSAEQMALQRRLLQIHFQQIQAQNALQAAQQVAAQGGQQQQHQLQPSADPKISPTLSTFSTSDIDALQHSSSVVVPFGGALAAGPSADTQEQIQKLYHTAAVTANQRQMQLQQQRYRQQQQQQQMQQQQHMQQHDGDMSTNLSAPHSPIDDLQQRHSLVYGQHAGEGGELLHLQESAVPYRNPRSRTHSLPGSVRVSRSGSVVSSIDGDDAERASFEHEQSQAHQHQQQYFDPPPRRRRTVLQPHPDQDFPIGGGPGDGSVYDPSIHGAHAWHDGDEAPLNDDDFAAGRFVQGCGGTIAAPLQYEEVPSLDGSGPPVQKPKRGQGYSCHHCKTTKEPLALYFCSSLVKKGVNLKKCRKKYCESCLRRLYTEEFAQGGRWWSCPSCKGACVCASCERKITGRAAPKKKKAGAQPPTSTGAPMTSGGGGHMMDEDHRSHAHGHMHSSHPFSTPSAHRSLSGHPQLVGTKRAHPDDSSSGVDGLDGGDTHDLSVRPRSPVSGRTPTKIRSRSNSAVYHGEISMYEKEREQFLMQQQQQQQQGGGGRPRHTMVARQMAQYGTGESMSPLSPLTAGGGSPLHGRRPSIGSSKMLARAGSLGDLSTHAASSRSRKASNPGSRGATPTHGLGDMAPPLHQRSLTQDGADLALHQQQMHAAARLRMASSGAGSPHFPPMHNSAANSLAPLSPPQHSMGGGSSGPHSRRRSSGAASASAPQSHSTSPFMHSLGTSSGGGSFLNSAVHSSGTSSAVGSDNSDADATSPHGQHTRSVSPPQIVGMAAGQKMHDYLQMKNQALARHHHQQQQQHHQQNVSHLLMSPPAMPGVLLSPAFPSSLGLATPGAAAASSAPASSPTSNPLSSPLSSTVTVGGMSAEKLSKLSLEELQAMNDEIEAKLQELAASAAKCEEGMDEDAAAQQQQQQHDAHASSDSHPTSMMPGASTDSFLMSPPLHALQTPQPSSQQQQHVANMGLNDLHNFEALLKRQQQQINEEQESIRKQTEEIARSKQNLPHGSDGADGSTALPGTAPSHSRAASRGSHGLSLSLPPVRSSMDSGGIPVGLGLALDTPLGGNSSNLLLVPSAHHRGKMSTSDGTGSGGAGSQGGSGGGMMSPLEMLDHTMLDHIMMSPPAGGSGGGGAHTSSAPLSTVLQSPMPLAPAAAAAAISQQRSASPVTLSGGGPNASPATSSGVSSGASVDARQDMPSTGSRQFAASAEMTPMDVRGGPNGGANLAWPPQSLHQSAMALSTPAGSSLFTPLHGLATPLLWDAHQTVTPSAAASSLATPMPQATSTATPASGAAAGPTPSSAASEPTPMSPAN